MNMVTRSACALRSLGAVRSSARARYRASPGSGVSSAEGRFFRRHDSSGHTFGSEWRQAGPHRRHPARSPDY